MNLFNNYYFVCNLVILDFDTSPKFDGTSLIPGMCSCWCPGMHNDVKGGIYFFKGKNDKN